MRFLLVHRTSSARLKLPDHLFDSGRRASVRRLSPEGRTGRRPRSVSDGGPSASFTVLAVAAGLAAAVAGVARGRWIVAVAGSLVALFGLGRILSALFHRRR